MKINIGQAISVVLTFFIAVVEALLGIRFVLLLLAANTQAEFTSFVFEATDPFTSPFKGVFPDFKVAGFTLEISTFLAMVVYGIAGAIFFYLARHIGSVDLKSSQAAKPIVEMSNQGAGMQSPYNMQPQMPQYGGQPQPFQQPQNYNPMMQTQAPIQTPYNTGQSQVSTPGPQQIYNPPMAQGFSPANPQENPNPNVGTNETPVGPTQGTNS